ncbi:hypothetical protein B6D60_02745 [candidate division KSB1 bacterium 4484_87]|nr:MAG: hypothetical protein B6D60_02745 [candidate division KSB1 bacterium 4484_87]
MKTTQFATRAALIGALYATLTIFLAPISFGPMQIRVSESLTVLPYLLPEAVPGLWIGCMVANIYGGLGPIDIFGGSLITLLAAASTFYLRRFKKPILAPLPPVLFNALGVSGYLQFLVAAPDIPLPHGIDIPVYFLFVLTIGFGELVSCYGLGYPLLLFLRRRNGQL